MFLHFKGYSARSAGTAERHRPGHVPGHRGALVPSSCVIELSNRSLESTSPVGPSPSLDRPNAVPARSALLPFVGPAAKEQKQAARQRDREQHGHCEGERRHGAHEARDLRGGDTTLRRAANRRRDAREGHSAGADRDVALHRIAGLPATPPVEPLLADAEREIGAHEPLSIGRRRAAIGVGGAGHQLAIWTHVRRLPARSRRAARGRSVDGVGPRVAGRERGEREQEEGDPSSHGLWASTARRETRCAPAGLRVQRRAPGRENRTHPGAASARVATRGWTFADVLRQ